MIVVTIELWPGGDRTRARQMGTAYIANDATSADNSLGNYTVMLSRWSDPGEPWRVARVSGFQRLRGSPWDLLRRAISAAIANRRNDDPQFRRRVVSMVRAARSRQLSMLSSDGAAGDNEFGSEAIDT